MNSRSVFTTVLIGIALAVTVLAATLADHAARAADSSRPAAWLGATLQDLSRAECRRLGIEGGVRIVAIETDGPADQEGLLEGDIIVEFEGRPVNAAYQVEGALRRMRPGDLARVRVWRDGEERVPSLVTLGEAPQPAPGEGAPTLGNANDTELRERVDRLERRVESLARRVDALEGAQVH